MKNIIILGLFMATFTLSLLSCAPTQPTAKKELNVVEKINDENEEEINFVDESTQTVSIAPSNRPKMADNSHALILVLHPHGRTEEILTILKENPFLKVTLLFPPNYFSSDARKEMEKDFRVLQSSGQIEIGMTLDNQPNLPLVGNLALAQGKGEIWDIDFAWPSDVADQIARGSALYQTKWQQLPNGFLPPYFALNDQVIDNLKRFRLNWVIAEPSDYSGVRFYDSLTLFVPELQPYQDEFPQGSEEWAKFLTNWVYERPFTYLNTALWDNPRTELRFFEALSKKSTETDDALITATELSEVIDESHYLPVDHDPFKFDFSDWVRTPQQARAWEALSKARRAVERYKNSGRANLRLLDSAQGEILSAEGGAFLLALGQTRVPLTLNERNFIATLDNVYRLCGLPIPPNLKNTFSNQNWKKAGRTGRDKDRPFFVEKERHYIWNDPKGDDFGGGNLTYPVGKYAKGSFDIQQFHAKWSDTHLTLTVSLSGVSKKGQTAILPLVDVYIDINRIADAGSQTPLPNRGPVMIQRQAAWEYAVCLGPEVALLYQSVLGKKARQIQRYKPRMNPQAKTMSVTIPLAALTKRNDPSQWRMTVALSGSETSPAGQSSTPVPIRVSAGAKSFGGASTGRVVPVFIDMLAPSVDEQTGQLSKYTSGRKGALTYLEPQ